MAQVEKRLFPSPFAFPPSLLTDAKAIFSFRDDPQESIFPLEMVNLGRCDQSSPFFPPNSPFTVCSRLLFFPSLSPLSVRAPSFLLDIEDRKHTLFSHPISLCKLLIVAKSSSREILKSKPLIFPVAEVTFLLRRPPFPFIAVLRARSPPPSPRRLSPFFLSRRSVL